MAANGLTVGTTNMPYLATPTILLQRDLYHKLIDKYQDDEWLEILTDSNSNKIFTPSKEAATVPTYYSFFNSPLYSVLNLGGASPATVTNGGTTTASLSVLSSTMWNSFVVGSLLYSSGGNVWRCTSKGTSTTAVLDTVSGSAPSVALTNAMVLSVFSNAQKESSEGASPVRWDVDSIGNYIQLFNNSISVTDVESMSMIEISVDGKPYLLPYEMIRGMQKHRGDISLATLIGQISSSTALFTNGSVDATSASGYNYQTTRGLDQYISSAGGGIGSLAVSNTVTLSDIRTLNSALTAARAPLDYFAIGAQDTISQYSDFLKNLPSSSASQPAGTGVNSARVMVNGTEINLEVEKFNYGGRTFSFKPINAFSNTQVINFDDGTGAKMAPATSLYLLPSGMTPVQGEGRVPYFRYRYMKPQGGLNNASANKTVTDTTVEAMTGFLAPVPTSRTKELVVEWVSNMGFELFNSNKFYRLNSITS